MSIKKFEISIIITVFVIILLIIEFPKYKNYYDSNLHAYFLNIGHGDSTLIKTPEKHLILIDGGKGNKVLYELGRHLPAWKKDIDLVIITHSDFDHISGVNEIIGKYRIKCLLYESVDETQSETEADLRSKLEDSGKLFEGKGVVHQFHSIQDYNNKAKDCIPDRNLEIFNTSLRYADFLENTGISSNIKNPNDESIISIITYKDFDMLMTGDAEIEVQKLLMNKIPTKDVEVIKVPHQGAKDGLYKDFIYRFVPDLAVFSIGINNYGHPHKEVIDFYESNVSLIKQTLIDDTVHITSDGVNWSIFSN